MDRCNEGAAGATAPRSALPSVQGEVCRSPGSPAFALSPSGPSMSSFIDAVHFTLVKFVVRKAPVQFPKELACTDGIVITQRRDRQHQLRKWLEVMPVKRRLANLLHAPLPIDVRARHSQKNTQRRRFQAQQIVLQTRAKVRVGSVRFRRYQSLGINTALLRVAQRGEVLLFDQTCIIGAQAEGHRLDE